MIFIFLLNQKQAKIHYMARPRSGYPLLCLKTIRIFLLGSCDYIKSGKLSYDKTRNNKTNQDKIF